MMSGWQTKPLGELCDILDTRRKPITKRDGTAGEYPYYGATGIQDYVGGFLFDEPLVLVGEDGAKWASGDQTAFPVSGKCWVNNHAHVLRPHRSRLTDNWLIHFLVHSDLSDFVSGLTVPKLNQGNLREIPIPLPPLPEQQRIVGILDEAFAGIATAKANAEKNLQNARALFESHLHAVFTHRGPGWVETKLDDVTDLITCGVAKRPDYVPNGVPFLSAKNVKNGQVIWSGYQFITEEAHRALTKHNKPRMGDILYTRVGSYGEAAIVDREIEFSVFVSLTLIKPKKSLLNAFLKHYLNSSMVKELAAASITGVGVGNLNVGAVREFPIHLPSFEEQESITACLVALQTETRRLEALYAKKLAALDELKSALLHQAFSGQL